jgi:hypothetical protein
MSSATLSPAEAPPADVMFSLASGYWVSQAVGVAARFGVADQLCDGPRDSDDIAARVSAEPGRCTGCCAC